MAEKSKVRFISNGHGNDGILRKWVKFADDERSPGKMFPRDPVDLLQLDDLATEGDATRADMGAMLLQLADAQNYSAWIVGERDDVEAWLDEKSDKDPSKTRREKFAVPARPAPKVEDRKQADS